MGLDMYLTHKTYVRNWDHQEENERHTITITGPSAATIKPERIKFIEEEVMYWRKANAIHGWFVKNCQNGVDECQYTYVSPEKLTELRDLCRKILKKELTPDALPPCEGFFFGSVDIDEDYYEDLRVTDEGLTVVLEEKSCGDFYYHSSW